MSFRWQCTHAQASAPPSHLKGATIAVSPSVPALRSEQGGPVAVVGRPLLGATPWTTSTYERVVAGLRLLPRVGWRCDGPHGDTLIPAWSGRVTLWCVPFPVESLREGRCLSPHNTRYILLPRGAPVLSRSSTHSTHSAAQHPPRGGAGRSYPTTDNTRHNPHPCAPSVAKGTPHAHQRHEGEGRGFVLSSNPKGFVLRSPKEGLSAGTWRRKVVMCPRRENDPANGHPGAH